ncbi:MAG: M13 family metallopeptidase [Acidobacteriota bacterium]|nr:M13 family metallopeptidase [Acidobacteriota bacterium]
MWSVLTERQWRRLVQTAVLVALPLAIVLTFARGALEARAAGAAGALKAFDVSAMDRTVSPCTDFYQYACGAWMKNNPIPADQSQWGRFGELVEHNRDVLHGILEAAEKPSASRDADTQKIGDYYAACMDAPAIDARGLKPLDGELARIAALTSKAGLPAEIARLHEIGAGPLFQFGSEQDFKNATEVIGGLDQGGLGLPDRSYYLKDDARSKDLRAKYVAHVQQMFALMGEPAAQAAADAQTVMRIETALAKDSLDRVDRRDPAKIYHRTTMKALLGMTPDFDWHAYFTAAGAPPLESLNVAVPGFFSGMDALVKATSLADWKTYLRWQLVHANASLLSTPFVDASFDFYGRTLSGQQENQPRWKRCVRYTDQDLGEALGKAFVAKTFGADGKARTLKMVEALEAALGRDIKDLPWMTEATKQAALVKLRAIANKIGYPDHWRDYSTLRIARNDALGNSLRANAFEFKRDLAKIGKPVDRGEWGMTPPTVNAYYNPQMNDINFPAGILQPPFFDKNADDAVNFGGIGAVIGHEMTHGFDDEGRQFDAHGNLKDWWTPTDAKQFQARADCLVKEYSSFSPVPGVHVNGQLTLGENTADNGGVRIALMALESALDGQQRGKIDGFTPEQRFFIEYGQIWCENTRPETARLRATIDPHSPGRFRVNGTLGNMPEFQKAFGCKDTDPMVRHPACRVW